MSVSANSKKAAGRLSVLARTGISLLLSAAAPALLIPAIASAADLVPLPFRVVPGSVELERGHDEWIPAALPYVKVETAGFGNCGQPTLATRVSIQKGRLEAKLKADISSFAEIGDWIEYCGVEVKLRFEVEFDMPQYKGAVALVIPKTREYVETFPGDAAQVSIEISSGLTASSLAEGRRFYIPFGFSDLDASIYAQDHRAHAEIGVVASGDRIRMPLTLTLQATHFAWEELTSTTGTLSGRFELWTVRPSIRPPKEAVH
ncbi:MAG: hypothetical protein AB8G23_02305 [Myxococcota bacterium]